MTPSWLCAIVMGVRIFGHDATSSGAPRIHPLALAVFLMSVPTLPDPNECPQVDVLYHEAESSRHWTLRMKEFGFDDGQGLVCEFPISDRFVELLRRRAR